LAGATLAEKLISRIAGVDRARAGDHLWCKVDVALLTDPTTPQVGAAMARLGAEKVFDPAKVVIFHDHFVPAKDVKSAGLARASKEFAREHGIEKFFEVGRAGICHVALPETGMVVPGDLVVGADSHTTTHGALGAFATGMGATDMAAVLATGKTWLMVPETIRVDLKGALDKYVCGKDVALALLKELGVRGAIYKALEFGGPGAGDLELADRFTMCNMAVEAGAKAGIFKADEKVLDYVGSRTDREPVVFEPDPDAEYRRCIEMDVSKVEPMVAAPHSPDNVSPASVFSDVAVDQVLIGSCTNGRIEDFRAFAEIMNGRKVHPDVRLIALPGSPSVLEQMIAEGIAASLVQSGGVLGPCTCGPCIGSPPGVLGESEVALFTTNRNFQGRSGARSSRVYLASPAVAAATAITGRITDPRNLAG